MQTRGFSNGVKARSSELPTTEEMQTRPFASPIQKSSQSEAQPPTPESLEKAEAFGYNGASIPLFAPAPPPPIQAKLTIGEPGDKYEEEADTVADRVVDQINTPQPYHSAAGETVQREEMEEDEVRQKPEVETIQREDMLDEGIKEDEEAVQTKLEISTIQRDEMPHLEAKVQGKAAAPGVGNRETVPQPQTDQNTTQDVSKIDQKTPLEDESLYAFVDGGVITVPLTVGEILIIVAATGIVINWKDITGNLTEVGSIVIDWVTDTASDVTDQIIDKLSQGVGIARGILEKARGAIEGVVSNILTSRTGDCTEVRHHKLQDDVNWKCKRLPRACDDSMTCVELRSRWQRNENCARARERINKECYGGGDAGHREAAEAARKAEETCRELYRSKC